MNFLGTKCTRSFLVHEKFSSSFASDLQYPTGIFQHILQVTKGNVSAATSNHHRSSNPFRIQRRIIPILNEIQEAFVELYEKPVLQDLYEAAGKQKPMGLLTSLSVFYVSMMYLTLLFGTAFPFFPQFRS